MAESPPPGPQPPAGDRPRAGRWLLWLFLLWFPLAALWVLHRRITPADWVDVTLVNLPADARRAVVLAGDERDAEPLPTYTAVVLGPPTVTGGEGWPVEPPRDQVPVRWRSASRHGVLVGDVEGRWRVYWLDPEAVEPPAIWRYLYGTGSARITLPPGAPGAAPPAPLLERIGVGR